MTKDELEKEAEEYAKQNNPAEYGVRATHFTVLNSFKDGAEFGYNKTKAETALLSQHILDLQKDKGNLTDKVRELEQQIEKMKCCGNCEHFNFNEPNYCHKGVYRERQYVCSEWEFGN